MAAHDPVAPSTAPSEFHPGLRPASREPHWITVLATVLMAIVGAVLISVVGGAAIT